MNSFLIFVLLLICFSFASETIIFKETFNEQDWKSRWIITKNNKFNGEWKIEEPETAALPSDRALIVSEAAKHYAIYAPFNKPLNVGDEPLVIQYEVRAQNGWSCAGAYIKLAQPFSGSQFSNETPYTIMFGPDKCGSTKLHFIFRHQNPKTKEWAEKHMVDSPSIPIDTKTHLYTLLVGPNTKFQVFIDNEVVREGDLLVDFSPPVNPPTTIDDPSDSKPIDWVDQSMIDDPDDVKPDDWNEDEPETIPDPEAVKPNDWLDDEPLYVADPDAVKPEDWTEADGDWEAPNIWNPKCIDHGCGEWEPPMIDNPNYRGKWQPRQIPNPKYQGEWKAKQIPNPNFFEDLHPNRFSPIAGIGFELWSMDSGITFDNIFIGRDIEAARQFAHETFDPKAALEAEVLKDNTELAENNVDWLEVIAHTIQENLWIVSIGLIGVAIPFLYLICIIVASRPTNTTNTSAPKSNQQEQQTTDENQSKQSTSKSKVD